MNINIFKAYDVRGKYPEEINGEAIAEIISAIIRVSKLKTIVVGRDARLSSPALYRVVIKGIMNNGLRIKNEKSSKNSIIHNSKFIIHKAGIITTPMLYFLVNHFKADIGIMITASHNPKEYNGLKIVGKKAIPISGKEILKWII